MGTQKYPDVAVFMLTYGPWHFLESRHWKILLRYYLSIFFQWRLMRKCHGPYMH